MTNQGDVLRAEGKIQLATERIIRNYPFHVSLLGQVQISERSSVDTMAVTIEGEEIIIFFNTQFVLDCTLEELGGVLLHELNHVIFNHLTMNHTDYPDSWALTCAQEVTVNEFVAEPLPLNPITLAQFPKLWPGESTSVRYRRLAKNPNKSHAATTLDDHSLWSEIKDLDMAKEVIASAVEAAVMATGKDTVPAELEGAVKALVGTIPGGMRETISAKTTGSLDWRQLLRRYVGQVLEVRPIFNRPPRRFPELLGIVPGAGRRRSKPKVMAVIDTSGSITADDLTEISGEMGRLARHCIVTIVECDSKIHEVYRYRPLKAVHGRGGTDLRPPLEWVFLRKQKPDCVIYFTDGYGPAPKEAPRTPVIWCITRGGKSSATWGRVVQMDNHRHLSVCDSGSATQSACSCGIF